MLEIKSHIDSSPNFLIPILDPGGHLPFVLDDPLPIFVGNGRKDHCIVLNLDDIVLKNVDLFTANLFDMIVRGRLELRQGIFEGDNSKFDIVSRCDLKDLLPGDFTQLTVRNHHLQYDLDNFISEFTTYSRSLGLNIIEIDGFFFLNSSFLLKERTGLEFILCWEASRVFGIPVSIRHTGSISHLLDLKERAAIFLEVLLGLRNSGQFDQSISGIMLISAIEFHDTLISAQIEIHGDRLLIPLHDIEDSFDEYIPKIAIALPQVNL